MRVLTSEVGDLLSQYDTIVESEAEIANTSLDHHLIINHDLPGNEGKLKGVLPLEHVFGFCKTFKKITQQL